MDRGMIYVEGGDKIRFVAVSLRRMGADRTIVNQLAKRIRSLGPPLRDAIRQSALDTLPHRNGLAQWVARAKVRVSVRRGASNAGVDLVVGRDSVTGRSDIKSINAGRVRHPLWGQRRHWYLQQVTPGFATRALDGPAADEFRERALEAIDAAVEQVAGGL